MSTVVDFPDGVIIGNVVVNHNIPQFVTQSLNLKRRSKERNIHQLSGTMDLTVHDERAKRRLESWIVKMRGRHNYFQLSLGGRFDASDHVTSNPNITSGIGIGANSLNVSGLGGQIWEGDMFTMLNDRKIYVAQNDVTSSGSNLSFYPPTRNAQPTGAGLNFQNVILSAYFEEDMQSVTYGEAGMVHTMTCTWVEYLG